MAKPKPLSRIRNMGIMAHIDAGKTTTTERILFYSGRSHKIGEVHEGEAIMDYMVQEREKGITITAAVTSFDWLDHEVHLIDTPGHVDFTVEVERSLRVLDGVVALYCGVSGVEPQSETVWYQADRYGVPRIAFVNKLDRVGADYERVVGEIAERFKVRALPVQIPWGQESRFQGVIDLIGLHALRFEEEDRGSTVRVLDVPADYVDAARAARERLIEGLADLDDDIAALYLEGEDVPAAQLRAALRKGTIALQCLPVLCGSSLRDKGIQPLMDAIVHYLPSPVDLPPIRGKLSDGATYDTRAADPKAPFSALAFKVQYPEGRRLVLMRLYSGHVKAGDQVLNVRTGEKERLARLFLMHAAQRTRLDEAWAGMIVGVAGLRHARTGDTLADPAHPILLESITAREPVISSAVEPETMRDRERLAEALAKLADEDATFHYTEDTETGELIMRGMGELHLEIIADRLGRDFNVPVRVGQPEVLHRETVGATGRAEGRFFRDTDDEHLFGHVTLEVSPAPRGSGNSYEVAISEQDAQRARKLLDTIRDGVHDALNAGALRGDPLTDVKAKLVGVTFEDGESLTPLGYRIAAGIALRNALRQANPILLQPLMQVEVFIPEENLGDVIGDLSQRQSHIEAVRDQGAMKVVQALAPLKAMFGYSTSLRSITQGRGTFSMEFARFGSLEDFTG
jgi:elongation factor G